MLSPILQADYFSVRAVGIPEPEGVRFDDFEEGQVLQMPPGDPTSLFGLIESGQCPEPEKAQKTADLSFVFFVGYGVNCKQFGLCVLYLFKWRCVIVGIFYIVCEIATMCCDEQRSSEQAVIETIFFHEPAF